MVAWVVTSICALFVFCVVLIHRSYDELMFSGNDLLLQQDIESNELNILSRFIDETRPLLERSTKRALQVEKLTTLAKDDFVDAGTRKSWQLVSSQAMIDASSDLASLDKFSSETVPLATAYLDGLRRVLNSELTLWRRVESYIDSKARIPRDSEQEELRFNEFTQALMSYTTAIASFGASAKQTGDRLLLSKEASKTNFQRQMNSRNRMQRQFRLGYVGAVISFLFIVLILAFISYPRLKRLELFKRSGSNIKKSSRSRHRAK